MAERGALEASYGEVVITYVQDTGDRTDETPYESFSISARFVRVTDADRQTVRQLLGEDLPVATAALEECSPVDGGAGRASQGLAGSLELLDAGDLVLRLDGQTVRIPDWSFPSVYGVVAGVLYGSDASLGVPYRPAAEYRVSSSGASQLGPVELSIVAPEELSALTIGGSEVGVEPVRIDPQDFVEVRWEPAREGAGPSEVVAELSWTQFAAEHRIACRSRDDGSLELPASATARLADPGVTDARLTVHRVVRIRFSAEGLDDGDAYFVVTANVPLRAP